MVEQENSSISPGFPESLNSSSIVKDAFSHPWFITEPSDSFFENPSLSSTTNKQEVNDFFLNASTTDCTNDLKSKCFESLNMCNIEEWLQSSSNRCCSGLPYFETSSPLSWGSCPLDLENMTMDDVFQVDKDDLVSSPTLAELNANDESLFDSFDCFNTAGNNFSNENGMSRSVLLKDESNDFKIPSVRNTNEVKQTTDDSIFTKSNVKNFELSSKKQIISSSLQGEAEIISKRENAPLKSDAVANSPKPKGSTPITSNKNKDLNMKESNTKVIGNKPKEVFEFDLSSKKHEEVTDDEDSDIDDDSSDLDEDSDKDMKIDEEKMSSENFLEKKRSRYFWQYNMQSKGPKGLKVFLAGKTHHGKDIPVVSDPVFSSSCPIKGVKHSGKARKGDGNDLTPNPKKLYNIGMELEKLNSQIDHLTPANELPLNARTKSRKEKNKLASRACRLKKKAQHEANKLKLFGLQQEQKYLQILLRDIQDLMTKKIKNCQPSSDISFTEYIDALRKTKLTSKIAGCSADFVNKVLKAVDAGDDSGGLNAIGND